MKGLLHELLDLIEHVTGLAVSADPGPTPADRIASLRDQVDALHAPAPAEAPTPVDVAPEVDPRDAKIAELQAQLASLQNATPAQGTDPAAPAAAATEAPA